MRRSGFSLIEVNMAVFVLAIGILSMAVLYPLGLREGMQSQADLKQSMFADYVLSVAVAAASKETLKTFDAIKVAIENEVKGAVEKELAFKYESGKLYEYEVEIIPVIEIGMSAQLIGIMVRSLDTEPLGMNDGDMRKRLRAQPLYYAEVRF